MSAINGSAHPNASAGVDDKGKGKSAATEPTTQDVSMDENDSSDEEEVDLAAPVADEEDPDSMEEIDPENIISDGRRTRGRQIDFAKAAKDMPDDDADEDDDDDFEEEHEDEDTKMN